jgi:hypothetical protein
LSQAIKTVFAIYVSAKTSLRDIRVSKIKLTQLLIGNSSYREECWKIFHFRQMAAKAMLFHFTA